MRASGTRTVLCAEMFVQLLMRTLGGKTGNDGPRKEPSSQNGDWLRSKPRESTRFFDRWAGACPHFEPMPGQSHAGEHRWRRGPLLRTAPLVRRSTPNLSNPCSSIRLYPSRVKVPRGRVLGPAGNAGIAKGSARVRAQEKGWSAPTGANDQMILIQAYRLMCLWRRRLALYNTNRLLTSGSNPQSPGV
jgi:hypothetical protein